MPGWRFAVSFVVGGLVATSLPFLACSSSPSGGPGSETGPAEGGGADTGPGSLDGGADGIAPGDDALDGGGEAGPLAGCQRDPGAPIGDAGGDGGSGDPIGGADKFDLTMALAGFPAGAGVLTAVITTELGDVVCALDDARAPITVANFVGLARGTRPARRASATWTATQFYDGLLFHRVVPNFVIQGGDPAGSGSGGPGYDLPSENRVAEPKGTLAMAAYTATDDAGATITISSGSQFYVVVGKGPGPDYNVFGTCTTDVANAIASVPASAAGRPKTPVHMLHVEIARCPK